MEAPTVKLLSATEMTETITKYPMISVTQRFVVMHDGFPYSRHQTEDSANQAAHDLTHDLTKGERVQELLDNVQQTLIDEFKLSPGDAQRLMMEYNS